MSMKVETVIFLNYISYMKSQILVLSKLTRVRTILVANVLNTYYIDTCQSGQMYEMYPQNLTRVQTIRLRNIAYLSSLKQSESFD